MDRGHGPRPQVRRGARVEHLAPRLAGGENKTPGRAALPPSSRAGLFPAGISYPENIPIPRYADAAGYI